MTTQLAPDDRSRTAPWTVLRIPSEAEFGDDELFNSTALAHRAEILADRHPDLFGHLAGLTVVYLWKKSGGTSKGRGVFGKTLKASGLLKHFSEADLVVWLAADHCRGANYSERQIEALLFHEMCHSMIEDADPDTGRGGGLVLVPHDVEMFRAEVEVYGLWADDLRDVAPAFRQAKLFDGDHPSDPDRPHDDDDEQEPDTSGGPPTPEEVALQIGRCPHGHEGCNGRHDLADDPLADHDL